MTEHSQSPHLFDIVEAIERINTVLEGMSLAVFEEDWQAQWLIQRGVEIVSEASRRLPVELKARHPDIPWRKVAGIGNVLRHDYENISSPIMWKLVREDLPVLERVCRDELASDQSK